MKIKQTPILIASVKQELVMRYLIEKMKERNLTQDMKIYDDPARVSWDIFVITTIIVEIGVLS